MHRFIEAISWRAGDGLRHAPQQARIPIVSACTAEKFCAQRPTPALKCWAFTLVALTLLATPRLDHAGDAEHAQQAPIIVFMTDYGTFDEAVAVCKGVMLSIAPDARIVDLTHHVTPYSIADGARFLSHAAPYFPAGTIFVGVVDESERGLVLDRRRVKLAQVGHQFGNFGLNFPELLGLVVVEPVQDIGQIGNIRAQRMLA